jgi:hypothetical protein
MKTCTIIVGLLTFAVLFATSPKIKLGDNLEQTINTHGKPMGTIELRDKTLLLYPEGEITLRDDLVTEIDLMTDEQFAADQERLQREREEWLYLQERLSVARIEEGKKLKKFKISSHAFAELPAKDRVDYWRSFQIRYPEIDASTEIANALEGYEAELQELKSQQRYAELEARVARAEKETAAARVETEKLRDEAEARSKTNYGLRYYIDPVIQSNRYYYRPPTVTIYSNGTTTTHHNHQNRYWENTNHYWDNNRYSPPSKQGQSNTPAETTAERIKRIQNIQTN